jgi:hypothetical protein
VVRQTVKFRWFVSCVAPERRKPPRANSTPLINLKSNPSP